MINNIKIETYNDFFTIYIFNISVIICSSKSCV
jgi:hypothetical protein